MKKGDFELHNVTVSWHSVKKYEQIFRSIYHHPCWGILVNEEVLIKGQ